MSTHIRQAVRPLGKTALVTGGSRGLGLQIAEALGEAGARVLLTSRKAGDLEESAAHLKAKDIEAIWIAADLSQPSEIVRVTQDAMARLGNVDILVNNAGATWGAPAEDHPLEAWDKVMNLNVALDLPDEPGDRQAQHDPEEERQDHQHRVDRRPRRQQRRHVDGRLQHEQGAVVNFTRTLAGEWGKYGINVNALAPGFFPSKMTKGLIEQDRRRKHGRATRRCGASATTTT